MTSLILAMVLSGCGRTYSTYYPAQTTFFLEAPSYSYYYQPPTFVPAAVPAAAPACGYSACGNQSSEIAELKAMFMAQQQAQQQAQMQQMMQQVQYNNMQLQRLMAAPEYSPRRANAAPNPDPGY